jgi:hypothetical protein
MVPAELAEGDDDGLELDGCVDSDAATDEEATEDPARDESATELD